MKRFLALALVVFGLAACQNDPEVINPVGGEVDYELTVAAPEFGSTRAVAGMDSAQGAIDNFDDAAIWNTADLRYILEIYNADEDGEGDDITLVKERMVQVVDEYEPVVFKFRIIPGRTYKFVVFADLVAEGDEQAQYNPAGGVVAEGLRHVIGSTLADITVKEDDINDEYGDAYFISKNLEIKNALQQSLELTRPYAKLRVITTDMDELNLDVQPGYVVVTYDVDQPTSFNAINGKIATTPGTKSFDFTYEMDGDNKVIRPYTAGKDAVNSSIQNLEAKLSNMTLFTDYVLAVDEEKPTKFRMDVYEDVAMTSPIKSNYFSTDIPLRRNYLTTIIGNVLTTASEVEITIDNKFVNEGVEDDDHYIEVWDGNYKKPAQNAAGEYEIYEGSELAWLAAAVNGTLPSTFSTKPADNFADKTFKLMDNIDLNNDRWTPIGSTKDAMFRGTFDGNGKTISNLVVESASGAGLFGCAAPVVIKDLTIDGAKIYGCDYAGAVVGWIQHPGNSQNDHCQIVNCHAKNVEVVLTPVDNDGGAKAGGLVGYAVRTDITGSSVNNVKVTAFRDCGGLLGMANDDAIVTGNSVANATVVADMTAEYNSMEVANAGAVVGRLGQKANHLPTVSNNTIGENVKVTVLVNTAENLAYQANNAKADINIAFAGNINGSATIGQQENVKVFVEGNDYSYDGAIVIDGKSKRYSTTAFTIQNVNFVGGNGLTNRAYINLGDGNNSTRYTNNVTVKKCTFSADIEDVAAVKSYTGGDYNTHIIDCTVEDSMHSLAQFKNIEQGLKFEGCHVYSKNGINLNHTNGFDMSGCEFDVYGYAIRVGESGNANTVEKTFNVANSTLKAGCNDGDAVIIFRGSSVYSTLNLTNTTLIGSPEFKGNTAATTILIDGQIYATPATVQAMIDNAASGAEIKLSAGNYTNTILAKSNITLIGTPNAIVGCINLNGADGLTIKDVKFNAGWAGWAYNKRAGENNRPANILTGTKDNNPNKGARNLVIDGCTFTGKNNGYGAAIAFVDQGRGSGQSGNITITRCHFETENAYDIYGYYFGYGDLKIENNTFKSTLLGEAISLWNYQSGTAVIVKDNNFANCSTEDAAMYIKDHSSYGVSFDATNNTFAN